MNAKRVLRDVAMMLGLLGAAVALGIPTTAQADQGKWWKPKESARRSVVHQERYQAPVWHGPRHVAPAPRYYRAWRGYRVYRDRVWVGPGWSYHRPAYGWRYYCAPTYYYPRHIVYVRPIRFFVSAGAVIGGVHVRATYADAGDLYGCNFCDARFHSFHAYENHVERCGGAPDGFRVVAQNWDSEAWSDGRGHDGDWSRIDED